MGKDENIDTIKYYAISKYSAKFYNEDGVYTRNEWAHISEIGREFQGTKLTLKDYIEVENRYINCFKLILDEYEIRYLTVQDVEKYWTINDVSIALNDIGLKVSEIDKKILTDISNGLYYTGDNLVALFQLMFRSYLWCRLVEKNKQVQIDMGDDLYMHL